MRDEEYDCQRCGACCVGLDVPLSPGEETYFEARPGLRALTVLYRRPTWWVRFMARDQATGRCLALEGAHSDCRCAIYEDRPEICRAMEPGSEACLAARRQQGMER